MRVHVAVAALAMLISNDLPATQDDAPSVQIIVAPIRKDAIECGIQESLIESAAASALRSNGVQTVAESSEGNVAGSHPYLVVSANVLRPGNCVANLLVEIKETVSFAQEAAGGFSPKAGNTWTVLCSSGTLMTGPAEQAGQHFYRAVESNVRGCLRQLDY